MVSHQCLQGLCVLSEVGSTMRESVIGHTKCSGTSLPSPRGGSDGRVDCAGPRASAGARAGGGCEARAEPRASTGALGAAGSHCHPQSSHLEPTKIEPHASHSFMLSLAAVSFLTRLQAACSPPVSSSSESRTMQLVDEKPAAFLSSSVTTRVITGASSRARAARASAATAARRRAFRSAICFVVVVKDSPIHPPREL